MTSSSPRTPERATAPRGRAPEAPAPIRRIKISELRLTARTTGSLKTA